MNWHTILSFLSGPILGAIIGLITNGIAIRMLFRPLYEKRISRFRVPFTPGLIPKEKARIARACGDVIGNTLLNEEVLKKNLLSEEMKTKISDFIDSKTEILKDDRATFNELFIQYFNEDQINEISEKTKDFLSDSIYKKICNNNLGNKIADFALIEIEKSSLYHTLSFLITEEALTGIKDKISSLVEDAIIKYGRQIIFSVIETEMNNILNTSAADIYAKNEYRLDKVKAIFFDAYELLIKKAMTSILSFVNIPKLVEERIGSFDVLELEKIILSIMNKELKAIVWLGGLLGMIMGLIMNFF